MKITNSETPQERRARYTAYAREWRKKNPEKVRASYLRILEKNPTYFRDNAINWRRKNPEKYAASKRRNKIRTYGITPEQYEAMLDKQRGACAICKIVPIRDLDIDHCHSTGKVRGLLCSYCNKAIGMFKDSAAYLKSALMYLENK